jgi:hypothetical protein
LEQKQALGDFLKMYWGFFSNTSFTIKVTENTYFMEDLTRTERDKEMLFLLLRPFHIQEGGGLHGDWWLHQSKWRPAHPGHACGRGDRA